MAFSGRQTLRKLANPDPWLITTKVVVWLLGPADIEVVLWFFTSASAAMSVRDL